MLLLLLLTLTFSVSLGSWTGPILLLSATISTPAPLSIYRDPGSGLTHVIVVVQGEHLHMAVSETGGLLYHKYFLDAPSYPANAVIRGAGDGQHLFFARTVENSTGDYVLFTESADGGITWKEPETVVAEENGRRLADMVYDAAKGQLHIFLAAFPEPYYEIRLVTRNKSQSDFGDETVVATRAHYSARAACSGDYMHVAYRDNRGNELMYTQSKNRGAKWSYPIEIGHSYYTDSVASVISAGSLVYVTYFTSTLKALVTHSTNTGSTFSEPIPLTNKHSVWNPAGTAFCTNSDKLPKPMLMSMLPIEGNKLEYSQWFATSMSQKSRTHPYSAAKAIYAALDCSIDPGKNLKSVVTFVTIKDTQNFKLLCAIESGSIYDKEENRGLRGSQD